MNNSNDLPSIRDGLTRKQRIIIQCINKLEVELGGRNVPTALLYGRVIEYMDISIEEMQLVLQELIGNKS